MITIKNEITFVLITLLFSSTLFGQFLVIGDGEQGGVYLPFQDTIINAPFSGSVNYYLDLDQDLNNDIRFSFSNYWGGMSNEEGLFVETYGDFAVLVDTAYQEYYQDPNVQGLDTVRTITVVQKYNLNDTVFDEHMSSYEIEYMHRYVNVYDPPHIYSNINLFEGDASFIAFTKETENESFLFYIKVQILNFSQFQLFYAKSNDNTLSIEEEKLITNNVYPNPTRGLLFTNNVFESAMIYNSQGSLVMEKQSSTSSKEIDITALPSGIYFLNLESREGDSRTKFLKL